jgi:hypothetical protein
MSAKIPKIAMVRRMKMKSRKAFSSVEGRGQRPPTAPSDIHVASEGVVERRRQGS